MLKRTPVEPITCLTICKKCTICTGNKKCILYLPLNDDPHGEGARTLWC